MKIPGPKFQRRASAFVAIPIAAAVLSACGSSGKSSSGNASTTSLPPSPSSARTGSGPSLAPTTGTYAPKINPADFVSTIDNKYFPLKPGTAFHFKGVKDGAAQTDDMVVTHKTKTILGVKATVIADTVTQGGKPIEKTSDWYAQDKFGNVWYLGEDAFELKNGRFALAPDSWESGVKGAFPGIIVEANPQPGDKYRQEYYPPGKALDVATILGNQGTVTVPAGKFNKPLVTSEFSPSEPQTEQKYYVAGLGEIKEMVVKGGHEGFDLVSVTHGATTP